MQRRQLQIAGWIIMVLVLVGFFAKESGATERRFTYTYGSGVLNPGEMEIEPWTTYRYRRTGFYSRFDEKFEFEVGLTKRLQTAFYIKLTGISQDTATGRESEFEFAGVSSEWKYKLLDPVADPIGMALYFEPGIGPSEAELEGKLIFDKRIGDFYTAFNIVTEYEWEYATAGDTESEFVLEFDLGLAYFLTPSLSVGLEAQNHNEFPAGEGFEHSALFVGPVVSYAKVRWWATLTLLPQLPALKGSSPGSSLALGEHERFSARLLLGFHI